MDGTLPAGSVSANDHDRNFKELLTTFFVEFLRSFFQMLAEEIDPDSIEFLPQEAFSNLVEGQKYLVDIVARVRFKGQPAYFLVHVEHQSDAQGMTPRRMFRYFSALTEKYDLPVYPIVVYSHDKPNKAQPNEYRVGFSDGDVLRFRYRVVQLNRLSWKRFLNTPNPVASALMAKMKIAERDRPRVKAECLRLMVTLKLDPARMDLIGSFVDRYLQLSDVEEKMFRRHLQRMAIPPEQKETVMEYVTSWERRGIEKGFQQGMEQGIEQGMEQGMQQGVRAMQEVLSELLSSRFGALDPAVARRILEIRSVGELKRVTHLALKANSISELGL